MVRFWGFVTILALIGLVVSSAWGQGKPNEQLAREIESQTIIRGPTVRIPIPESSPPEL